jgi:serine/threonine protein kinase
VRGSAKSCRRESNMTPELWQRLKPLFHAALEKDIQNRAAFVDVACGKDFELKMRLEELLEAEQQDTGSLDAPLAHLNGFLDDNGVRFQPGELVLGRFRIIRPIGKGGMGEVYEAEDLQLGIVALKTIRQGIASSLDSFERFRQEVQLARRVSGPEVCRIHELYLLPASGRHEATAFLTMEYLEGITLHEKIQRDGPLPWKEAMSIALEICEGLRLIHEKGIIHRDLKSGNIMLCKQAGTMRIVLMDFGLARDFGADTFAGGRSSPAERQGKTLPQMIMGTPEYMAPEQFEAKTVSPATDIYALGVILYELVTGLHPYAADTPVAAAIRRAKLPLPPSSLRPRVPGQCDRIIECCLKYDPEKRFQSAKEVAKALRAGPTNIENLKKDRPWVLWLASAVVLGLIAGSTFFFWQSRQYYRPNAQALRWYDAGVAALREGNNIKATRSLQEAVSQDNHFVMAHARLAEAWANLDFDGNAQRELLVATPGGRHLQPLDRMYLDAIHATVTKEHPAEIATYRQILNRLPPDQKPSGYVDLGVAYERAGDPNHALENYARAASLNSDNPAPFMHTAILQSRLHHVPEADKAFQRAQALLSMEMNQEGLADLDYERGYAVNVGGDPALAERYLERALEEAKAIPSVQLQIRTLTQLSSAAYSSGGSDRYDQAVKYAQEAIHLAQSNQLDVWAANGFVRLANAELRQGPGHLQKAEDAVQEALQLSHQGQQRRTEAGANLALASIMDQRHLPDQVIAPAQSALGFYTQNGFFRDAANASLLLIRAQRDKGEYSQALQSGKAFQELAAKSGVRQLMALSEEVVGTVYLEMEQYPNALERFQNARSMADGTHAKAYQALHCADTLWRLGRYSESDEILRSVPTTETFEYQLAEIRLDSLLSRMKYREADALAQKTLADQPTMGADRKQQLELDEALAEIHLKTKPAAFQRLEDVSNRRSKDSAVDWGTQLSVAEVELSLGMAQQALDGATKAADHFDAKNQLDSELRSLCIAASASKNLNNTAAYEQFSKKTVDISSQLQQTWDPQALRSYMSRPDLQALMRGVDVSAPLDRR